MKAIKNCWDAIGAADCEFCAHVFDGSVAKIYVHHGLDVGLEMSQLFGRKSDEGYAGHCLLVFCGIKTFDFVINPYEIDNVKPEWKDPIAKRYIGDIRDGVKTYNLGGGIHGFQAYVSIEIEARDFDLHLLEESDPAWRS